MTVAVTPEKFQAFKAKLATTHEATVVGDDKTGSVTGHGVTAVYAYDGKTLTVQVTKHPFFIPVSHIESELAKALA